MKPGPKPLATKICPRCGLEKSRSEFYKKGDTISHKCKPCSLEDIRLRAPRYFGKYAEKQNAWRRANYQTEQDYRDKIAEQKKSSYEQRKEEINQRRRDRWKNDPFCPARKYFRRKDVKHRTPKWADMDDILSVYANCPKGHEVDHIIPLKGLIDGRPVTGLHVPWNLQYLTKEQNRKKRNRITEHQIPVVKR